MCFAFWALKIRGRIQTIPFKKIFKASLIQDVKTFNFSEDPTVRGGGGGHLRLKRGQHYGGYASPIAYSSRRYILSPP